MTAKKEMPPQAVIKDREAWFLRAVEMLRPRFEEVGLPVPALRVAVGFGPKGARAENKVILGVTLSRYAAADGVSEIWISPEDADSISMLGTLVHEIIHAGLDHEEDRLDEAPESWTRHGRRFAEPATRLGLTGKMTSTVPGPELEMDLLVMADALGPYPGARVDLTLRDLPPERRPKARASTGPGKQGTRLLKVECPIDGYLVRTTAKWLAVGFPMCPAGHVMERAEPAEKEE